MKMIKRFVAVAVVFAMGLWAWAVEKPLRVLAVGEAVSPVTCGHLEKIVREKGHELDFVTASPSDWRGRQGPWDIVVLVPPAEVMKTREGLESWGRALLAEMREAMTNAVFLCRQPFSWNVDDIAAYDALSRNCMYFTVGHDVGTVPAGFAWQCYVQERHEGTEGFGGYGGFEENAGFEGAAVPAEYVDACVWAEKLCELGVRDLAYAPQGEYEFDDLDLARRCALEAVRIFSPIPVRNCKLEAIGRMTPMAVDDEWWKRRLEANRKAIAASGGTFDLVFVGSSQMHIWDTRCPRQLRDIKRDFTLLNLGYSGDSFQKVCWRLTKGRELDGYKAKCIMLVQGGNNTKETPSAIALGIKQILDVFAIKQPQAKVLLMPVNPRREWDCGKSPWPWAKVERANERLRHYADGKDVIWVDFREELLDENDDTAWCMPGDRLHLGEEGLKIWYSHISPLFHEICGKPLPPETAGWVDRTPLVRKYKPNPYIWAANLGSRGGFVFEKRDGAEGKVDFRDGRVMIHKTNDRGSLVLKAHPFASHTNVSLRLYADVEVALSEHARSFGCLTAEGFGTPGVEEDLVARPAGCRVRWYCEGASTNGDVRPVIVVSGAPSKTYWSNWRAEELTNPRRSHRLDSACPVPEKASLVQRSGACAISDEPGLRVAVDGDTMEIECYCTGRYEVRLPAPYDVAENLKTGLAEPVADGELKLNLVASGVYRFKMYKSK